MADFNKLKQLLAQKGNPEDYKSYAAIKEDKPDPSDQIEDPENYPRSPYTEASRAMNYVNSLGGLVPKELMHHNSGSLELLNPTMMATSIPFGIAKGAKALGAAEEAWGGAKAASEAEHGPMATVRRFMDRFKKAPEVEKEAIQLARPLKVKAPLEHSFGESYPVAEDAPIPMPTNYESDLRIADETTKPGTRFNKLEEAHSAKARAQDARRAALKDLPDSEVANYLKEHIAPEHMSEMTPEELRDKYDFYKQFENERIGDLHPNHPLIDQYGKHYIGEEAASAYHDPEYAHLKAQTANMTPEEAVKHIYNQEYNYMQNPDADLLRVPAEHMSKLNGSDEASRAALWQLLKASKK
jgi:hypothetical protein